MCMAIAIQLSQQEGAKYNKLSTNCRRSHDLQTHFQCVLGYILALTMAHYIHIYTWSTMSQKSGREV